MSSTHEIQLSDAEVEALTAQIEAISSKEKVLAKPILRALLSLINKPVDISSLLRQWLSKVKVAESFVKVFHSVLSIPASVHDWDLY
jgi:hypothetical protein